MLRSILIVLTFPIFFFGCATSLAPVGPVQSNGLDQPPIAWPDFVPAVDRQLLVAAEEQIAAVRQGELLVRVQTAFGVPVPHVSVRWTQESRQFAFGVDASFESGLWGDLLRGGIDIGVATLDWASTEPAPDVWRIEPVVKRHGLAVLPRMGVRMMGSAALWMTPAGTPSWVRELSGVELEDAAERHVRGLVERLRGQVAMWEAVRDPNAEWTAAVGKDPTLILQLARASSRAIRAVDPVTPIAFTYVDPIGNSDRISPLVFSQQLQKAGADYDVVGLHYLYNGATRDARGPVHRSLRAISASLDDFALLKKPIQVTAVSAPSIGLAGPGDQPFWGRSWDEELQAAYLQAFYVLAFSKPSVTAVVWRDALDEGAHFAGGGLFRRAGSAKPSWYTLRRLLERWKSFGQGDADEWGRVRLRGYGGAYRIEVTDQVTGRTQLVTANIRERELTTLTVTLPEDLTHVEQDVVSVD